MLAKSALDLCSCVISVKLLGLGLYDTATQAGIGTSSKRTTMDR